MKCERGHDEKGYAVFHHDTENRVNVTFHDDACGSNIHNFSYSAMVETILLVIDQSSYCEQNTKAECKGLRFVGENCTWLLGRSRQVLDFWGGGPQNGVGCACGLDGTCTEISRKCNCDTENGEWQTDEGLVTLKAALPLAGIAVGDVDLSEEILQFTIGPLKCVI